MDFMSLWNQGNLDPEAGSLLASPYPLSVPRARGLRPPPSTFHVLDFICVCLYFGLRTCMCISCGTTGIRTCSTSPWVPTSITLKTSKPPLSTNDLVSNSCPNIINMSNSSGPQTTCSTTTFARHLLQPRRIVETNNAFEFCVLRVFACCSNLKHFIIDGQDGHLKAL